MSLISIGELIEGWGKREVVIPLLQRNYKWKSGDPDADKPNEKNTAVKLMQDILDAYHENKEHIIGLITAYKDTSGNIIQVIDGQQRLITLTLIAKALGKQNDDRWVKLTFERDTDGKPRGSFIKDDEGNTDSVDVGRMEANLGAVRSLLSTKKYNAEELFEFILSNITLMYRETEREPLEEFLNMNFKKTPFCASDYIKAYMLMDCKNDENNSVSEDKITVEKVLSLWQSIQFKLFSLKEEYCVKGQSASLVNDMFALISKNYNHYLKNRIEILFEDNYYKYNDEEHKEIIAAHEYYLKEPSLKTEYERLENCNRILDELLSELCIKDINGKPRPNYTAYNAYELLCQKRENVRFFKMFRKKEDVSLSALIKEFNLTQKSEEEIRKHADLDDLNQFTAALMDSYAYSSDKDRQKKVAKSQLVAQAVTDEKIIFAKYYREFHKVFDEYIEIVNAAKQGNNEPNCTNIIPQDNKADNSQSPVSTVGKDKIEAKNLLELFDSVGKTGEIIVPCIQRDYVMGSFAEDNNPSLKYIEEFLSKIRFMELRARLEQQEREFKPDLKDKNGSPVSLKIPENFKAILLDNIFPLNKDINGSLFDITHNPNGVRYYNRNSIYYDFSYSNERLKYYYSAEFIRKNLGIEDNRENLILPHECHRGKLFADKILVICNDNSLDGKRDTTKNAEYLALLKGLSHSIEDYLTDLNSIDYTKKFTPMNFSCITGFYDKDNNKFWVYDGQQRLSTVVVMLAASLFVNYNEDVANVVRKFRFDGRDNANTMLEKILEFADEWWNKKLPEQRCKPVFVSGMVELLRPLITDQTCYSIYTLFCRLVREKEDRPQWDEFKKIDTEYLLKGLSFELVVTDKTDVSEQLFIELNEGEQLIDEEEYKARLSAKLGEIIPDERGNIMRRVDNEWLDVWKKAVNPEKAEFALLQYCMTFAHHELKGYTDREEDDLSDIDESVIHLALAIFDDFSAQKPKDYNISQWITTLEYTEKNECLDGKIRFDKNEFKRLIEKLANNKLLKEAFEIIRQHRSQGYVKIETETAESEENSSEDSGSKSLKRLLKHRQNRYRAAVYCNTTDWTNSDESKPPFSSNPYKPTNGQLFDLENNPQRLITELRINDVDTAFKTLLYNDDNPLKDRTITVYRIISGGPLKELVEKNNGQLPPNSSFTIWNTTTKLSNANNISENLKYLEKAKLTIENILNSQFYDYHYKKHLEELLVNKGQLCLNLLNTDNPPSSLYECLKMWTDVKGIYPPSLLRTLIENFDEISDEDFEIIKGKVGMCVKISRDDILQYASIRAAAYALKGDFKTSNNDLEWLRYTIQNYLKDHTDFAKELLIEGIMRANNTNDMGFDFRSLFPAEAYLKCASAEAYIMPILQKEYIAYIRELGFAKTDKNGNVLADSNAIDNLIKDYNKNFNLPL